MDNDRSAEELYLSNTLQKIEQRIQQLEDKTNIGQKDLTESGYKLWDEITHVIRDFDDVAALTLYDADITRQEDEYRSNLIELRNMLSLYSIPYFGRLDFISDYDDVKEKVYIGAHSFMDRETFEPYVYDWRTPIASMYYDSEIGPASFESPDGTETGNITLMRRYRVRDGKLMFMYDAATGDDMLGYVLSDNAQARLKVIVESIQKEQNRVIRDEGRGDLLVLGPAGSGKTSVGLHRFAYLLYRYRGSLNNSNFLIISRNGMFSSYIGDILPELGEEDAKCKIYDDILLPLVDTKYNFPSYQDQLDYIATADPKERRMDAIRIKSSFSFLSRILKHFRDHTFVMPDITANGEILMQSGDFSDRCNEMHKSRPFSAVLAYARDCVTNLLDEYFERNNDLIHKQIAKENENIFPDDLEETYFRIKRSAYESANTFINTHNAQSPEELYIKLLKQELEKGKENMYILKMTEKNLENSKIEYEDALVLALIRGVMGDITTVTTVRQILLDEAQDFSPFQHLILKMCYPRATFTLLADINQNIFPFVGIENEEDFAKLYRGHRLSRLTKSYRSTGPINKLAAGFIHSDNFDYFNRDGDRPKLIKTDDMFKSIKELIESDAFDEMQTVSVICPNLDFTRKLSEYLGDKVQLYDDPDKPLKKGVCIMPAVYSKGLEFDAVIAVCPENIGRNMLYLLCTRALHKLTLICGEKLPMLIQSNNEHLDI